MDTPLPLCHEGYRNSYFSCTDRRTDVHIPTHAQFLSLYQFSYPSLPLSVTSLFIWTFLVPKTSTGARSSSVKYRTRNDIAADVSVLVEGNWLKNIIVISISTSERRETSSATARVRPAHSNVCSRNGERLLDVLDEPNRRWRPMKRSAKSSQSKSMNESRGVSKI